MLADKRRTGIRLCDLTISNPTEAFADYPHADIAHAYGAIPSFRYEPDPLGMWSARETVARWYLDQQIPARPERIALTASTSEGYAVLFKLLCDPGDEILIPYPSYPLFDYLARAETVKTVPYPLTYDGAWFIDFVSLEKSISPRSKAIVVVNPNNPTGSFLKTSEAETLAALAQKYELALISDEVFMTYPAVEDQAGRFRTFIGHDDVLSFSMNGLSKAAGMPQMKLGWIAVNGPAQQVTTALAKLELLLDNYLSVATPVQCALPELLRIGSGIHTQIRARIRQNLETLNALRNSSVAVLTGEAGWSAILQIPNVYAEDEWIAKLLTNDTVVVQPGYFYDMAKEAFVVVSLITNPVDFAEGIDRLRGLAARC